MCTMCHVVLEKTEGCDFEVPVIGLDPSVAIVINNDDAAPDSINTTNSMDVGNSFFGTLDYVGDWDWVEIDLDAGETVQIDLIRLTLNDPFLWLYDANGNLVASNDDNLAIPTTTNAQIVYTVESSGTYYIAADSYNASFSGSYVLSVSEYEPDPFDPLDSIDTGFQVSGSTINVYFGTSGYTEDGIISEGFNAYERAQFMAAFEAIEAVTDLTFNIVTNPADADFRLILDTNEGAEYDNALGYFYFPTGSALAGLGVFNGAAWDRASGGTLEQGGFDYVTIVHEILHGLGLAHPHDNGGGSIGMEGVSGPFGFAGAYDLNQGLYTTMTYNSGYIAGPLGTPGASNEEWGYEAGPMALDIAVLQNMYGANMNHNTGNNTYVLPGSNTTGTMWMSIWDAGGDSDHITYSGSRDTTIDLRAATLEDEYGGGGFISAAEGVAGGFTIANGVVIENATTGSGNDTLQGNAADNVLTGGSGNDMITGDAGDDELRGNQGDDEMRGGAGNDIMYGGNGDDLVRGSTGDDTLYGGEGEDQLIGQRGEDTLIGGDDDDILKGGGDGDDLQGDGGNDFLKGGTRNDIAEGGDGDDRIFGNRHDDMLFGGAGNDFLNGGGENDTLDGGTGNDSMKGGSGADSFVFGVDFDRDNVLDFNVAEDTLLIDASFWDAGESAQDLLDDHAEVTSAGVVIDLGGGNVITLDDLTTTDGLADQIDILL